MYIKPCTIINSNTLGTRYGRVKLTMDVRYDGSIMGKGYWVCHGYAKFPNRSRRFLTTVLHGRNAHEACVRVREDWKHRVESGNWD